MSRLDLPRLRGASFNETWIALTVTFVTCVRACVIDQNVTHHLRADGEEVCAVLPVESLLTREFQVCLVNKCSCLQRVTGALLAHLALSDPPEFHLDEREELVERRPVAFAPIGEQLGDFLRRGAWASMHSTWNGAFRIAPRILTS